MEKGKICWQQELNPGLSGSQRHRGLNRWAIARGGDDWHKVRARVETDVKEVANKTTLGLYSFRLFVDQFSIRWPNAHIMFFLPSPLLTFIETQHTFNGFETNGKLPVGLTVTKQSNTANFGYPVLPANLLQG
ncbi:hypothetical protein B0H13DRAFT_1871835 [Mycena leptocephala]|nr:hypothetical protein B0H13DRAFT_1871835 [Mycena leptocephala]